MKRSGSILVGSILAVAVVFVISADSFAGSVTSRWDAHLGGMVKFDYGYTSQAVGPDADFAQRRRGPGGENVLDKTGNQFWASGETRLNVGVKGPPVWSALTSAFIEADFRGQYSNSSYVTFNLRHAYMKIDWHGTSVLLGQTWQPWGIFPNLSILKYDEDGPWNRGVRIPQITLRQELPKGFSVTGGFAGPTNAIGSDQVTTTVNGNTKTDWPDFSGELLWKTKRFGKIGAFPLQFGAGGFIGSRKIEYNRATGVPVQDPDGIPGSSFGNKTGPYRSAALCLLFPREQRENEAGPSP